jgi:transposase
VGALKPLIPDATPGGRPRKTDMRAAMNAIFYLVRTGCPWRGDRSFTPIQQAARPRTWVALAAILVIQLLSHPGSVADDGVAIGWPVTMPRQRWRSRVPVPGSSLSRSRPRISSKHG